MLRLVSTWSFLSLQENGGQLVFVPYAMYCVTSLSIGTDWRILLIRSRALGMKQVGWLVGYVILSRCLRQIATSCPCRLGPTPQ